MRPDPAITRDFYQTCYPGYPKTMPTAQNGSCLYFDNLEYICGFGGFAKRTVPDQSFRFITPMFLHTGVLDLIFIMIMQVRFGFEVESQLGSIRVAIVYLISGISGNVLAAILNPLGASVGASCALYGMLALLYLDLLQNWPLLVYPWRNLSFITAVMLVMLCIGLLPFIDNYAHIGGFGAGIFAGLIFMPKIAYGKWDKIRKLALTIASIPILIVLLYFGFTTFYNNPTLSCSWCIWLDCVPPTANWCSVS